MNNALKHSQASLIEISLTQSAGRLVLSVTDDGVGLPAAADVGSGFGLHTMNYRANLIGATLQVRRRPETGTEVVCAWPIP